MKKVELGNTGQQISQMSLGCMLMGSQINQESSYKLLDSYVQAGGSFLDTANCYAWWVENGKGNDSELLLGQWMKARNNRQDIFLATKIGANPTDTKAAEKDFLNNIEGLSEKAILAAVDKSLNDLQTDYIDLLYIHIDDRSVPLQETMSALNKLVDSGLVKHLGCSNMRPWRIEQARGISRANHWAEFSCVQQSYTYLNPRRGSDMGINEYVDDDLLDYAKENKDLSIMAYSPLMGGYYTRPDKRETYWRKHLYENAGNETRLQALSQVAGELGVSENQVVLAWLLQKEVPAIPVIAATQVEHLQQNMAAGELTLSAEQVALLENS
ncbi:aldo/keto reductase [Photobacterium sp. SDRW27]|uniref:aldo/keto reductase n=1 Tax=Photobacterium obscurum TaxID=2829490 RepID=UPI0022438F5D|nr:aldo/keto reductase [Photobacterium obscurum]MCW8328879.1 aldo/keto reductase [Photobacterium obscurum]